MAFGQPAGERRLDPSKIPALHHRTDVHSVGMQCFKPTQRPPGLKNAFVLQKGFEQLLVVPTQSNEGRGPLSPGQSFEHARSTRAPIDVVAKKYCKGLVEYPPIEIAFYPSRQLD